MALSLGGFAVWGALALAACQAPGAGANPSPGPSASSLAPAPASGASLAPAAAPSLHPPAQDLSLLPQGQLRLGPASWQVAIAEAPAAQTHGLSGQPALAAGRGLLFLWPQARSLRIWMPDMNFPIDVLFFRDGELKAVFPKAQPCASRLDCPSFGPDEPCDAVLELGAGEAERLGVTPGQRYELLR